jgi:hypothetical protein
MHPSMSRCMIQLPGCYLDLHSGTSTLSFSHFYPRRVSFTSLVNTIIKSYIMSDTAAEGTRHAERASVSMDSESPSIASLNPAPDDSQRDVDITPSSDKQHIAPAIIVDMSDYEGDSGAGDMRHANRSQVPGEDERESERARQAIYDQWDEEERRMKALEAEEWALKRKEPIQAHLQALHEAYRNVDPEYTVFAFGGTIPSNEVDAGKLTLHVAHRVSPDEAASRFDGQMKKKGDVGPRKKKGTRAPKK